MQQSEVIPDIYMYENESKLINLDQCFIGTNLLYNFTMTPNEDISFEYNPSLK